MSEKAQEYLALCNHSPRLKLSTKEPCLQVGSELKDTSFQATMDAPTKHTLPSSPNKTQHTEAHTVKHDESDCCNDPLPTKQPKELINLILQFLSTSSNEKLIFVIVCLAVTTYIILGRLGLLLIGVTIGIIIHASWEGPSNYQTPEIRGSKRRELSLSVTRELLDWQYKSTNKADSNSENDESTFDRELGTELDPEIFGPMTSAALRSLIDAVIKDYVNHWYEPILPSELTFPLSCRKTLTSFIMSISSHLYRKRTADTFLEFLTNSSSVIVVFLNELSSAFGAADPALTPEQTIARYLDLYPESSLSNILGDQHRKLNMISDDMLSNFLDSRSYKCSVLRDFLREILSGIVLESALSSLSRPEFINSWIVHLFSEGESEIMNAIDAGVEGARVQGASETESSDILDNSAPTLANSSILTSMPTPPLELNEQGPPKVDKATEEAIVEAKRLSEMIAAQDLQNYADQAGCVVPENEVHARNIVNTVIESREDNRAEQTLLNSAESQEHEVPLESSPSSRPSHIRNSLSLSSHKSLSTSLHPDSDGLPPSTTLYRASITLDDDSGAAENGLIRSKPTWGYLLQVEPLSTRCTGWMVFRTYTDFESIHETLSTISRLNNLGSFTNAHPVLPQWKGQKRRVLARSLERYVQDALQHEPLAESERMRRFLEKDGRFGLEPTSSSLTRSGFQFPSQAAFENVGKGVLGVFASAPKGVSGGGKAVLDGVTGVFGGGAIKKTSSPGAAIENNKSLKGIQSRANGVSRITSEEVDNSRHDEDLVDVIKASNNGASPSYDAYREKESNITQTADCEPSVADGRVSCDPANERTLTPPIVPNSLSAEECDGTSTKTYTPTEATRMSTPRNKSNPITQDETRMAVELIFAVINELYSLSSAWAIRRTLLNAAKSYILRPGNPSLETIRSLLQDSMIDGSTSDESIGFYLEKLRENALPTGEELNSWPPPISDVEKNRLRDTARRVFIQRGLPQAITGVMGAAASREALGKVFDCLQVESIARGLMFCLLLQALKAVAL